ncbi:MAG: alpha-2-macroglobulin family protein [Blastocatellia bacterium]
MLFRVLLYTAIIIAVFSLAIAGMRAQGTQPAASPAASPAGTPQGKPYFMLSTNRIYGTSDRARIWINYRNVSALDFRVYRVNDPAKFFRQLNDPHQMGEAEKQEVGDSYSQEKGPTVIERVGDFKSGIFENIRNYFRGQLRRDSRAAFNEKVRGHGGERERIVLNTSDYASIPLLNSQQVAFRFRQTLPPLRDEWDNRMILLGQMQPGVYLVEAVHEKLRAYTIAIVSDLSMLSKTAPDGSMLISAVDRKSGEPRADVKVEVVKGRRILTTGVTDKDGLLKTKVEREAEPGNDTPPEDRDHEAEQTDVAKNNYLIMMSGKNQFAISDLEPYHFGWYEQEEGAGDGNLSGYIYAERPVYRPGQKAYFRGILRKVGEDGFEGVGARTVSVSIEDPNNGKIYERELPLSPRGTFNGEVELAGAAPLGYYNIRATAAGNTVNGNFEVDEYKKPEYKVTVRADKAFAQVGATAKYTVEAKYFFGEPVRNAEVQYYIYRSRYSPWWWQGEDDWNDGIESEGGDDEEGGDYGYGNDMVKEGTGKLDANGRLVVDFTVPEPEKDKSFDFTYRLEARVTDASRREMEGKASFVGTRGNVIAWAQPERYVYYKDDAARIKVRTTDYEGKPVPAKVTLRFMRYTWDKVENKDAYGGYEYKRRETELSRADFATSAQGEGAFDYKIPATGSIDIQAIVHENGREILSQGGYLWVTDRSEAWGDFAYRDEHSIKLIPDKKAYKPGETAKVLAILPTENAQLLITTEREKVMTARRARAAGRSLMIDVPIEARHTPNIYLSVSYIKEGELYTTDRMLAVPARDKFLKLEILPDKKEYKPRDAASYTVLARYGDGSPAAGAEVSLGIVDEAVYSIRPDNAGDIRRAFYSTRYNKVQTYFSTEYRFSGHSGDKPVQLAQNKRAYQLADFKSDSQYAEPAIRKEFKDTAFWSPALITGPDGRATASFTLPDNLTTWRATARAVTADTHVGSVVSKVIARKDLILRLETPRFLTEGDTVTLSGIVHNYLKADKSVKISLEVTGGQLLDAPTQTVTIRQQGEARIDWRVAAARIGEIRLLAKALTDTESDGVELPLNVVPQGLKQTSGAALTLAEDEVDKTIDLNLPANASNVARALKIEASPSIAGSLFGALDYLTSYPYGCTEQTMSSFLPNVTVAQVLKEVKGVNIRADNNLGRKVQRGLDRLYEFQHEDGGWGWWREDKTHPLMTAYVVDGLAQAAAAGYAVDTWRIEKARKAIQQMLSAGKAEDGNPINPESRAYLVYALYQADETDLKFLNEQFNNRAGLQPYGRALLALALKLKNDSRATQLAADIERTVKANQFEAYWESREQTWYGATIDHHQEATALSIKALSRITPKSQTLPKAARWLLANRRNGHYWHSTLDTAFAIYGLVDYIKVTQENAPDYTLEVYLNGEQLATRRVTGTDAASAQPIVIERRGEALPAASQVRIVKRGKGTLWFSSALEYYTRVQSGEQVAAKGAADLKLTREYLRLRVDESKEKPEWKLEPLSGEIRSGDYIAVKLHLTGNRAERLLIEDPIPAGCEQVDSVSGATFDYTVNKFTDWYSAREFRDQKTALFIEYFDGDATFQYVMRVQIPGDFKVAPARAERMYQPMVNTNTANGAVRILDKK